MLSEAPLLMDRINRTAWGASSTVKWFKELEGWTDPGERAAFERLAAESTGRAILDLGVGGGRTVPLLRAISRDYVAIDYTQALVEACSEKYPDVDVAFGDARDLSRFADGSFKLVVFSFNGIDAVNPDDRLTILREVHRVLQKGGLFLFSAHNREGPGHGERLNLSIYFTRNPFKMAARLATGLARAARTLRNRGRLTKLNYETPDCSILNAAAHDHGSLFCYTSREQQVKQLESAGFEPMPVVFGNVTDQPLSPDADATGLWWLHYLARK